jgi:hypothetical protein
MSVAADMSLTLFFFEDEINRRFLIIQVVAAPFRFAALDSFQVAVLWFCCAKVFHKTTT